MATIEWFGATTFRLKAKGLTIFMDTWLRRPSVLPVHLNIDDVTEADYIVISHAHFDHLPGADQIAIRTGAIVIANYEAIRILRDAGVPDAQLVPVAGGERIPLFTKQTRDDAAAGKATVQLAAGPPLAPKLPHDSLAVMSVQVWPSLHCLIPGSHDSLPDVMDSGQAYFGAANPYECTLDMNRGMRFGLLEIEKMVPPEYRDDGIRSFIEYIQDQRNVFGPNDGGQLMYQFLIDGKGVLFNAHLGAYRGIMQTLDPMPEVAILGIAGRANLDGRPFEGSAAQFALNEVKWLKEPKTVIWCLQDESPVKPYRIDTKPAKEMVEANSSSRITDLKPAAPFQLGFG